MRRVLIIPPPRPQRRVLHIPPKPEVHAREFVARHPLAGQPPLPLEQWPDRVYGYHPLMPDAVVICIQRDTPGYFEVSPEINPYNRNREIGVEQEIADAVIRTAWSKGGHAWK